MAHLQIHVINRQHRCFTFDVMTRCILLAAVSLLTPAATVLAQTAWPSVTLPKGAHVFDIGQQMDVNGVPTSVRGFASPLPPDNVAAWFHRSLERPLIENRIGNKRILGKLQGEHYLTIQLEPAGSGTRGLIAMSHLKGAYENRNTTAEQQERLLSHLPLGSKIVSNVSSRDAGRISRHIVVTNTYSEDVNLARIRSLMSADGMTLERETTASQATSPFDGRTLYFRGAGKEAIAVIFRSKDHLISIVLNTTDYLDYPR
jgi:hypothetical protein